MKCNYELLVICSLDDQVFDDVMRFVDVVKGAIPQASNGRIIFFASDVIVRLVEQFLRAVEAPGAVHARIDWRMVVQIFAIIDCGTLDFFNRFIDFVNRMLFFFVHLMRGGQVFKMSAGVA